MWKLNKAVYGLNQASRQWYDRVNQELCKLGMIRSKYDEALYYWRSRDNKCEGIIAIHVDDFLYGGTGRFHKTIIEPLKSVFVIGSFKTTPMKYLGVSIKQNKECITLDQKEYILSIEEIDVENGRNGNRLLTMKEQRQYRGICGQLNWVATQSRPDIAFDVGMLSAKLKEACVKDLKNANKVLRKIKSSPEVTLKFPRLKDPLHLQTFCDASYANLSNGGSQGGMFVFLADKEGQVAPLSCTSKRLRRVCRSTISAETMAMLDSIDTCIWLRHIIEEINGAISAVKVKTDNMSLTEAVHSTTSVEEKRLRVDIAAIRDDIKQNIIVVEWISKENQVADVLTKQGANQVKLICLLKNGRI